MGVIYHLMYCRVGNPDAGALFRNGLIMGAASLVESKISTRRVRPQSV